jgi:hypothetical protein
MLFQSVKEELLVLVRLREVREQIVLWWLVVEQKRQLGEEEEVRVLLV